MEIKEAQILIQMPIIAVPLIKALILLICPSPIEPGKSHLM
jgi:hypothetical protein